jgi:hypothetical protein
MPQLGFGASRIYPDTAAVEGLVCATINYASDFSAGVDGYALVDDGDDVLGAVQGNIDGVGGLDDNLRIRFSYASGTANLTEEVANTSDIDAPTIGCAYRVSFRVFFATGNTVVDRINSVTFGGHTVTVHTTGQTLNSWINCSADVTATSTSNDLVIQVPSNSSVHNEFFYLRTVGIVNI